MQNCRSHSLAAPFSPHHFHVRQTMTAACGGGEAAAVWLWIWLLGWAKIVLSHMHYCQHTQLPAYPSRREKQATIGPPLRSHIAFSTLRRVSHPRLLASLLDGMACPTQGPFPGRKSRVKDDELGSQVKLGKMLGQRARKFKSYAQGYDAHQAEVKKSILTRFSKSIQVFSSQKHWI